MRFIDVPFLLARFRNRRALACTVPMRATPRRRDRDHIGLSAQRMCHGEGSRRRDPHNPLSCCVLRADECDDACVQICAERRPPTRTFVIDDAHFVPGAPHRPSRHATTPTSRAHAHCAGTPMRIRKLACRFGLAERRQLLYTTGMHGPPGRVIPHKCAHPCSPRARRYVDCDHGR